MRAGRWREWKTQDTISARIPKDVDPNILDWLSELSSRGMVQATVIEALHRMYYDDRGIETIVVQHEPSDRVLMRSVANTADSTKNVAVTVESKGNVSASTQETTEQTDASNQHDNVMDRVMDSAISFYES